MKLSTLIYLLPLMIALNVSALNLNIPSYPEESVIPNDYTCDASDFNGISPQLLWNDIPAGTMSFAVVFNDETLNFLHWKLYNIDPSVTHIPEGKPVDVGVEGITNFGNRRYGGPCPPGTGHYVMTVYALNTVFASEPSVGQIQAAAIESASWAAFRSNNSNQQRYEYLATYRVTFNAEWTATSHPIDFPNGSAHFSPLIGNTHSVTGKIWEQGGTSTDGIEQMAETGGVNLLNAEIDTLINSSGAESRINGAGASNVDSIFVEFTVSESHPLFSMVSMIAPSPDWFIGVDSLDLREGGLWRENFSIDLLPYDAGTQDGDSFNTPGANTIPREPVERIVTNPFPSNIRLGQFIFERLSVEGTPSPDLVFENGFE